MELTMLTKIGRRIKNIRQLKGYTQEDLAERANLSLTCISRLENEKSMVSIEKLWTIAKTLDTDLGVLLCDYISKTATSAEEAELLSKFQTLSPDMRKSVIAFMDILQKDTQ